MGLFRRKLSILPPSEPAISSVEEEKPAAEAFETIDPMISPAEEAVQFVLKKTVIRTHYVGGVAIPVNVPKMGPPTDSPPAVQ